MTRAPTRRINVYDGSRLLGTVRETDDRRAWKARDERDAPLGEFRSSTDAARAITDAYDRAAAERLRLRKVRA